MAILGRSQPNHPIILRADGVQVVGTQAIVVSAPRDRRFYVFNKGTSAAGSGEFKQSPQVNLVSAFPPDRRFLRVNHPYIAQGSGVVTDVSPQPTPIVVTRPVDRRFLPGPKATIVSDPGLIITGPTLVNTTPVDRRFLRVNTPTVGQGVGADYTVSVYVVAAPRRKILAPQPIVFFAPQQPPAVPGSPPSGPYVFPGPNPHRVTKGPFILTTVEGIAPVPPAGDDIDWCPGPPFIDWHAGSVISDWFASDPATNWMALTPVEDC